MTGSKPSPNDSRYKQKERLIEVSPVDKGIVHVEDDIHAFEMTMVDSVPQEKIDEKSKLADNMYETQRHSANYK